MASKAVTAPVTTRRPTGDGPFARALALDIIDETFGTGTKVRTRVGRGDDRAGRRWAVG